MYDYSIWIYFLSCVSQNSVLCTTYIPVYKYVITMYGSWFTVSVICFLCSAKYQLDLIKYECCVARGLIADVLLLISYIDIVFF